MIEPAVRERPLAAALADPAVGVDPARRRARPRRASRSGRASRRRSCGGRNGGPLDHRVGDRHRRRPAAARRPGREARRGRRDRRRLQRGCGRARRSRRSGQARAMTVHVRPPRRSARRIIPIRRAGVVAAEFCRTPAPRRGRGRVRAQLLSARRRPVRLHRRAGDRQRAVDADRGHARGAARPASGPAGDRIAENRIAIGADDVHLRAAASRGIRRPGRRRPRRECWRRRARAIVRRAATDAPAEGFGRVLADPTVPPDAFVRVARQRLARLRSWLVGERHARDRAPADPVRDLVGLGPGLTPSGDDVLVGALALLDALARTMTPTRAPCAHIWRARSAIVPPGLTSPLQPLLPARRRRRPRRRTPPRRGVVVRHRRRRCRHRGGPRHRPQLRLGHAGRHRDGARRRHRRIYAALRGR